MRVEEIDLTSIQEAGTINGDEQFLIIENTQIKKKVMGVGATYTWATKPSPAEVTGQIFISNVGVGGSYWYSDGSKWRPVGGRVTLKNTITEITNNGAAKVVMDYATLLAGLVQDGDTVEVLWSKERTGGTSDTDLTELTLGTVAGTVGTVFGLTTSGLATTNIWVASRWAYRKESSTSVRPMSIAGTTGFGVAASANQAYSVDAMDTQTTYLQITSDLTTAGGEVVNLRGFRVTLIAGS